MYRIGDQVRYVSKCTDHDNNPSLILDEIYEVIAERATSVQIQTKYGGWWVRIKHLELASNAGPYYSVIRKIKSMEQRRKELGYKW